MAIIQIHPFQNPQQYGNLKKILGTQGAEDLGTWLNMKSLTILIQLEPYVFPNILDVQLMEGLVTSN